MISKSIKIYTAPIAILLGLGTLCFCYIHFSPWFFQGALPSDGDVQVVINTTGSKQHLLLNLAQDVGLQQYLDPQMIQASHKIGYATSADSKTLIILPKLIKYRAIKNELEMAGWNVKQYGLVLKATQGQDQHSQAFIQTLRQATVKVWEHRLNTPDIMATVKADTIPKVSFPVDLKGTLQNSGLKTSISLSGNSVGSVEEQEVLDTGEGLYISLPSQILENIDPEIWEKMLQEHLGFKHTAPDIINGLKSGERVIMLIEEGRAVIGVIGNDQPFATTARAWANQEFAYYTPTRKAFQLPDGTLGYEMRATEQEVAISPHADSDKCFPPNQENIELWLCHKEDAVVLSTSKEAAMSALQPSDGWALKVGRNILHKALSSQEIQGIQYMGDETGGALQIRI